MIRRDAFKFVCNPPCEAADTNGQCTLNVGGGSISSCNVDLACYGTSEVVVSTGHVIIPKVYLDVCYRCKGKTVRQKQEAFIYLGTL